MALCVFAGASPAADPHWFALAKDLGREIGQSGQTLVFGGGARGMMGAVAQGALDHGGKVIGVLPQFLFDREPPHSGITELQVVATMHDRKAMMYNLSSAFIALPGGFGTLEETLEVLTWRQLSLHDKPVIFLGAEGFWSGMEATFDRMADAGFLTARDRGLARFCATPQEALILAGERTIA